MEAIKIVALVVTAIAISVVAVTTVQAKVDADRAQERLTAQLRAVGISSN
jgi:hypothetical protein